MPKVRRVPIGKCSNSTLSLPKSVPGGTTLFGLVSKFLKNIGNRKLFFNKPLPSEQAAFIERGEGPYLYGGVSVGLG